MIENKLDYLRQEREKIVLRRQSLNEELSQFSRVNKFHEQKSNFESKLLEQEQSMTENHKRNRRIREFLKSCKVTLSSGFDYENEKRMFFEKFKREAARAMQVKSQQEISTLEDEIKKVRQKYEDEERYFAEEQKLNALKAQKQLMLEREMERLRSQQKRHEIETRKNIIFQELSPVKMPHKEVQSSMQVGPTVSESQRIMEKAREFRHEVTPEQVPVNPVVPSPIPSKGSKRPIPVPVAGPAVSRVVASSGGPGLSQSQPTEVAVSKVEEREPTPKPKSKSEIAQMAKSVKQEELRVVAGAVGGDDEDDDVVEFMSTGSEKGDDLEHDDHEVEDFPAVESEDEIDEVLDEGEGEREEEEEGEGEDYHETDEPEAALVDAHTMHGVFNGLCGGKKVFFSFREHSLFYMGKEVAYYRFTGLDRLEKNALEGLDPNFNFYTVEIDRKSGETWGILKGNASQFEMIMVKLLEEYSQKVPGNHQEGVKEEAAVEIESVGEEVEEFTQEEEEEVESMYEMEKVEEDSSSEPVVEKRGKRKKRRRRRKKRPKEKGNEEREKRRRKKKRDKFKNMSIEPVPSELSHIKAERVDGDDDTEEEEVRKKRKKKRRRRSKVEGKRKVRRKKKREEKANLKTPFKDRVKAGLETMEEGEGEHSEPHWKRRLENDEEEVEEEAGIEAGDSGDDEEFPEIESVTEEKDLDSDDEFPLFEGEEKKDKKPEMVPKLEMEKVEEKKRKKKRKERKRNDRALSDPKKVGKRSFTEHRRERIQSDAHAMKHKSARGRKKKAKKSKTTSLKGLFHRKKKAASPAKEQDIKVFREVLDSLTIRPFFTCVKTLLKNIENRVAVSSKKKALFRKLTHTSISHAYVGAQKSKFPVSTELLKKLLNNQEIDGEKETPFHQKVDVFRRCLAENNLGLLTNSLYFKLQQTMNPKQVHLDKLVFKEKYACWILLLKHLKFLKTQKIKKMNQIVDMVCNCLISDTKKDKELVLNQLSKYISMRLNIKETDEEEDAIGSGGIDDGDELPDERTRTESFDSPRLSDREYGGGSLKSTDIPQVLEIGNRKVIKRGAGSLIVGSPSNRRHQKEEKKTKITGSITQSHSPEPKQLPDEDDEFPVQGKSLIADAIDPRTSFDSDDIFGTGSGLGGGGIFETLGSVTEEETYDDVFGF